MGPINTERRMGNTDALLLRLERSALLRSTILQVALLDRAPDAARLRAKVLHGTGQISRFRQVPVSVSGSLPGVPPTWVTAADFDVDYHLRFSRVAGSGDLRSLLDEAGRIAMQAFDPARPLWESHIVEGLQEGRAAAIQKIHHALGDGVSLLDIILLFVDLERDPAGPPVEVEEAIPEFTSWLARTSSGLRADARSMVRATASLPDELSRIARDPAQAVRSLLVLSRSLARLAAPGSGPLSPIMQGRSLGARFDTMVVPLDELRSAAKRVGGKLNTAFLAAVAGGLGRYHAHHGSPVPALRCAMPVNTRDAADASLGNQFSPTRFRLPVDIEDVTERLEMARDLTARQRSEPALSLAGPVARVLNTVPAAVLVPTFEYVMRGIDVVVSSVPGASIQLYVAGARSVGNFGFSPRAGAGVNITVISHLDELDVAVNSDPAAIPDPEVLMECLWDSFDEIRKLA
jgi:diacylglycerol O-acyltransferase / wax synthase